MIKPITLDSMAETEEVCVVLVGTHVMTICRTIEEASHFVNNITLIQFSNKWNLPVRCVSIPIEKEKSIKEKDEDIREWCTLVEDRLNSRHEERNRQRPPNLGFGELGF